MLAFWLQYSSNKVEKQFSCRYCAKRFNRKGLNRHETSLHIRPFSWFCAALASIQDAFHGRACLSSGIHALPSHDSCGYCGEKFPNSPCPDWARRFEHLKIVHHFDECTHPVSYRGDNFCLHLRDCHAGIPGWWMKPLERACRKEEQPPGPRDEPGGVSRLQGSELATQEPTQENIHFVSPDPSICHISRLQSTQTWPLTQRISMRRFSSLYRYLFI